MLFSTGKLDLQLNARSEAKYAKVLLAGKESDRIKTDIIMARIEPN